MKLKKVKLGDLLLKHEVLSVDEIDAALKAQKASGMKLGNTLVELGLIGETKLLQFLAQQLDISFVELNHYKFDANVVKLIPETIARRYRAVVIDKPLGHYMLAMVDPTDVIAFDEISKRLDGPIEIVVVREIDLLKMLDEVFRRTDDIATIADALKEEIGDINVIDVGHEEGQDAPILKLLYSIFEDAVQIHASDIHIEPDEDLIRIRHRVDGVLSEQIIKGKSILSALILRLKLMAKLNISQRRLPQDGRFAIQVNHRTIDVRIATMPVESGEAVVMRLFDQSSGLMSFDELGMPLLIVEKVKKILQSSHGMVLVTGPTGSGKSTTLYAALEELNTAKKKIITVEDPIEYTFSRINQVQVHPKIGLNFSNVLRTALRHDPDIIMVGEIRDEETATIAARAAITGHLVLSTLHTNNAISSPGRLLEMGVPGYLVASALRLVVAQRLIRRLCLSCQTPYRPTEQETLLLNEILGADTQGMHFLAGKGCSQCNMTGYKGRIGIYEVLEMNSSMLQALRQNDMEKFEVYGKKTPLYRNLIHWGLDYACMGLTSIQEVFRLIQDVDDE
jgi:MSHA biogenesis protein MshE